MVYIVSGFWRSGTSMMMHALAAGGMSVVGESDPWGMNIRFAKPDGYKPNPNGFYQFVGDHKNKAFPDEYAGKVVKLPWHQAESIPPGDYRVIFMRRDPAEIRKSWELFIGTDRMEVIELGEWGQDFLDYDNTVTRVTGKIKQAGGLVTSVDHNSVINNPQSVFQLLTEQGWLIPHVAAAAAAIDVNLYRARG